jgi:hypothetical protein
MDMLRHDDAEPATPEDAALIEQINNFMGNKDALPKIVRVTLKTSSRFAPNVARWESFSARVVECSDPTITISRPAPEVKFGSALKGVEADFADAMASLTPKQAWACKLALSIQAELSRRLEKISPHQARQINADEGIEHYVARIRQEITTETLRQQAAIAQRRPPSGPAFLTGVREQIIETFGDGARDTFQIGDVVYATVRGRNIPAFAVEVDGNHVEKVFS